MNRVENIKIKKTKTGRRYFTVDMIDDEVSDFDKNFRNSRSYTNGYVEIDKDAPLDYNSSYYDRYKFWYGPTFLGLAVTDDILDYHSPVLVPVQTFEMLEDDEYLKRDMSNLDEVLKSIKSECREPIRDAIKAGKYFWIVGFDDNHSESLGRPNVISRTEQIANQMDIDD